MYKFGCASVYKSLLGTFSVFKDGLVRNPLSVLFKVQLLYSLRLPIMAVLWSVVFSKRLSALNVTALALILAAVLAAHFGKSQEQRSFSAADSGEQSENSWFLRVLTVVAALASSFAAVSNEFLLRKAEGSANLQNAAMYTWGMAALFVVKGWSGTVALPETRHEYAAATTLALLGVVTAYFLKYLGCIWREAAGGVMLLADVVIDSLNGADVNYTTCSSYTLAFVGISIFVIIAPGESLPKNESAPPKNVLRGEA